MGNCKSSNRELRAIVAGPQIVTVAIRRTNIGQNKGEPSLLDVLPPSKFTMLPNSAGCYSAEDAVRTLRLGRELLDGHPLTKLEVLGDPASLYPNMPETIKAAETLVKEGFEVMVYCSDDPIQAQVLESIGCVAVMPLASLIGSGMGILNPWNIQLILDPTQGAVIYADAAYNITQDVLNELNTLLPNAQLVPPQGWVPREVRQQQEAAALAIRQLVRRFGYAPDGVTQIFLHALERLLHDRLEREGCL